MFRPMFVPPRGHPLVMRVANTFFPALAHAFGNIRDVQVPDEDFARLEALRPSRAILSPNHPTGNDPFVPFWLSRRLGEPFNYLAAREVLDGAKGWLMNRVGCYSVIRGVADRESLRTTRKLLSELDRKVVIFPEGEIYEHNDTLLTFQSGVAQLGFWALDDLEKLGKDRHLPILPIAIKYRCCDSPRPAIDNSLHDLEQALDLAADPKLTAYQRLRRIGDRVLTSLEKSEGVKQAEGEELSGRITAVRRKMLERVSERIGAELDERQPPADQLHELFNELKGWVNVLPNDANDYDERLYHRRIEIAAPLFLDLQRLQNFIAFTGDYVATDASAERFLDVLGRLEKEVLGKLKHPVAREALVRIAEPIRLEECYDDYRANKRQTVTDVTARLERNIRDMLRELSSQSTPFALDS
jgi:1-acyl-sn-glycerol-3-phosphate acyltransferase